MALRGDSRANGQIPPAYSRRNIRLPIPRAKMTELPKHAGAVIQGRFQGMYKVKTPNATAPANKPNPSRQRRGSGMRLRSNFTAKP